MSTDLEKYIADILKYLGFLLIIPFGKFFDIVIYKQGEYSHLALFTAIGTFVLALLCFSSGYIILRRRSYLNES